MNEIKKINDLIDQLINEGFDEGLIAVVEEYRDNLAFVSNLKNGIFIKKIVLK